MPGCGLTERNFADLHPKIGAKEYHLLLPGSVESKMLFRNPDIYMGGMLRQAEYLITHTDLERVKAVTKAKL